MGEEDFEKAWEDFLRASMVGTEDEKKLSAANLSETLMRGILTDVGGECAPKEGDGLVHLTNKLLTLLGHYFERTIEAESKLEQCEADVEVYRERLEDVCSGILKEVE